MKNPLKIAGTLKDGMLQWDSLFGSGPDAAKAERRLGERLTDGFTDTHPLETSESVVRFATDFGGHLAKFVEIEGLEFSVQPLKSPQVDAYALPGGFVFVTTGLLKLCAFDQQELAFALGHEMAHVFCGHATKRMRKQQGVSMLTDVLPIPGKLGSLINPGTEAEFEKAYPEEVELEADRQGAALAVNAGFQAEGALRLLERLARESDRLGPCYARHPAATKRIEHLTAFLQT